MSTELTAGNSTPASVDHSAVAEPQTLVMASTAQPVSEIVRPVSREEIINWSIRGISDDVILDRLQHSNTIFHLSAGDEIHLRDAGVSEEVVRAMRSTAD